MREQLKDLTKQYDKSENDLKALQSVGQIVGEVLKQLTEEKCEYISKNQDNRLICLSRGSISSAIIQIANFKQYYANFNLLDRKTMISVLLSETNIKIRFFRVSKSENYGLCFAIKWKH